MSELFWGRHVGNEKTGIGKGNLGFLRLGSIVHCEEIRGLSTVVLHTEGADTPWGATDPLPPTNRLWGWKSYIQGSSFTGVGSSFLGNTMLIPEVVN